MTAPYEEDRPGSQVSPERPVVGGDEAGGPVPPGGSAGADQGGAGEWVVPGDAHDPGASYVREDAELAGRYDPDTPNQRTAEPMPPSPPHDLPPPADGSRRDDHAGTATSPGPREGWATAPPSSEPSGDTHGVPVPSSTPAEGTSEGVAPIEGVSFPAIAPEGLADGEPDVAMPSTTSF